MATSIEIKQLATGLKGEHYWVFSQFSILLQVNSIHLVDREDQPWVVLTGSQLPWKPSEQQLVDVNFLEDRSSKPSAVESDYRYELGLFPFS